MNQWTGKPDDQQQSEAQPFHRYFVYADSIELSENGGRITVRNDLQRVLMSNLVQYNKTSLSEEAPYCEATISSINEEKWRLNYVMFGLTTRCYLSNPIWSSRQSLRYHSDSGGVFNGDVGIRSDYPYSQGDTVGCLLEYGGNNSSLCNFLKNGYLVLRQWVNVPCDKLYATIGFSNGPVSATVIWPTKGYFPGSDELTKNSLLHWIGYKGIVPEQKNQTFQLQEIDETKLAFTKQAARPLNSVCSYFEIELLVINDRKASVGIGLTPAVYDKYQMPGWDSPCIGYHADDGGIFHGSGESNEFASEGMICDVGDRQGIGIIYLLPIDDDKGARAEQTVLVYFTRNTQIVYHKCVLLPPGGFYPTIGLLSKGDIIKIDMHASKPHISPEDISSWSSQKDLHFSFCFHPSISFTKFEEDHGKQLSLRRAEEKACLVQYIQLAISADRPYFEVNIASLAVESCVCIGIAARTFPEEGLQLGRDLPATCAYNSKDNELVSQEEVFKDVKIYTDGDHIIGVYLEFFGTKFAIVVFLRNQEIIGRIRISLVEEDTKLYASITLEHGPINVEAKWPGMCKSPLKTNDTSLKSWWRGEGVSVSENLLTLSDKSTIHQYVSAQAPFPLGIGESYFEVIVIKPSSESCVPGIGLSPYNGPLHCEQGTQPFSACFYGSSHSVVLGNAVRKGLDAQFKCYDSDRIGCGTLYLETSDSAGREEQNVIVYFTRNGEVIYHGAIKQKDGGLYPTICFISPGTSIQLADSFVKPYISPEDCNNWLLEADPDGDMKAAMFTCELLDDVVKYTNFGSNGLKGIRGVKVDSKLAKDEESLNDNYNVDHIFISHNMESVNEAKLLRAKLINEGYSVSCSYMAESGGWTKKEILISDMVLIYLTSTYCRLEPALQEFHIFNQAGIPKFILQTKGSPWPPEGILSQHKHVFLTGKRYYRMDCTTTNWDPNAVVQKVNDILYSFYSEHDKDVTTSWTSLSDHKPDNPTTQVKNNCDITSKKGVKQTSKTCIVL